MAQSNIIPQSITKDSAYVLISRDLYFSPEAALDSSYTVNVIAQYIRNKQAQRITPFLLHNKLVRLQARLARSPTIPEAWLAAQFQTARSLCSVPSTFTSESYIKRLLLTSSSASTSRTGSEYGSSISRQTTLDSEFNVRSKRGEAKEFREEDWIEGPPAYA